MESSGKLEKDKLGSKGANILQEPTVRLGIKFRESRSNNAAFNALTGTWSIFSNRAGDYKSVSVQAWLAECPFASW